MIEFFTPEAAPFTVSLIILVLLGVVELASLLVGFSPTGAVDASLPDLHADVDLDAGHLDVLSHALGWISVGKLPLLVVLVLLLAGFSISGYAVQLLAHGVLGAPLHVGVASTLAAGGALLCARYIGGALARVFPKDHSEAASQQEMIGAIATIIRGTASLGKPAEAKAKDLRGRTHYLLVEPDEADEIFAAGDAVLIVRQQGGSFRAVTKLKAQ